MATKVAFVVVVGVVRALIVVVVVCAALIFRISTTLVVRVLGLWSMHMAGLSTDRTPLAGGAAFVCP